MTIKTSTVIYCDSPNCEESYEMLKPTTDNNVVYHTLRLEGWHVGKRGKYHVCGACVGHAEWAKAHLSKSARISRRKLRTIYHPVAGQKYYWYHPETQTHGYGSEYPPYSVLFAKNQ